MGPWCGWGFVLRLLTIVLSAGAAGYYTWALSSILSSQRYSLSNLQLKALTAFVFTSNQNDAFVHSEKTPSALVNYSFTRGVFDLHFGNFGDAGSPTNVKLFLDVSGAQFGRVHDLVEFDVDLTSSNK